LKYYGFKFKKSVVDRSNFNPNVATWIGVWGTFIFIVLAGVNGGFKGGPIGTKGSLIFVAHPAFMWFLCLLSIDYLWPRRILLVYSILSAVLAFALTLAIWIEKQFLDPLSFLLFLLSSGVPVLILRKRKSLS